MSRRAVDVRAGARFGGWLVSVLAVACSAGAPSGPTDGSTATDGGPWIDGGPGIDTASLDRPAVADTAPDSPAAVDATGITDTAGAVDLGGIPFDGAACGATRFDVHAVPPDVLVLLDRSCSMRRTPTNGATTAASGMSKWSLAVAAIHGLTMRYPSQVRWGLIYLPRSGTMADGVTCTGTAVCGGTTMCPEAAPAPGTGPAIDAILGGISPFVGCTSGTQVAITPLDQGLLAAGGVSQLHDVTRGNYVLLITDGEETCVGAPRVVSTVAALRAAGIRTAVVGFGAAGAGGVNPAELNAMAMAGGVPAMGATRYYAANDAASLQTALAGIVGGALSCAFPLGSPPSDPSLLHVYVNAVTELPRDPRHAMGWDYDPASHTVSLYGSACADVRALRSTQLDVVLGCPGSTTPPPPPACHHMGQPCASNTDCCNLEGLSCDTSHGVCIPSPG